MENHPETAIRSVFLLEYRFLIGIDIAEFYQKLTDWRLSNVSHMFRENSSLDVCNGPRSLCPMDASIHKRLKTLHTRHPEVYREFMSGKFTINQSGKPFSNIGIDQAHEQSNKRVKIDGGAVDILLTDNSSLTKWMVAGLEIADMVNNFRLTENEDKKMKHHEDTISFEKRFRKDVQAFSSTMRELGNPFAQTDNNLVNLISKIS